jgi:hypothetical protein
MRRYVSLILCGLLSGLGGCHHITGVCVNTCCCPPYAAANMPASTPMVQTNSPTGSAQARVLAPPVISDSGEPPADYARSR